MTRLHIATLLALSTMLGTCAACATLQDVRDPASAPANHCERVTGVGLDPTFTAAEEEALFRASQMWSQATGGRECFTFHKMEQGSDLYIIRAEGRVDLWRYRRAPNWEFAIGMWLPENKEIWLVMSGLTSRDYLVTVAAHEIGHFLGIKHTQVGSGDSILYPDITEDFKLSAGTEIPQIDRLAYCRVNNCW